MIIIIIIIIIIDDTKTREEKDRGWGTISIEAIREMKSNENGADIISLFPFPCDFVKRLTSESPSKLWKPR